VRREINRLSRDWPRKDAELKDGMLQPTHLESLVEVLFRHDALMHACAIDVSREDRARVDQHKADQCDGMTRHLTTEHHSDLIREVWDLRRVLEGMSRQLYIQCVMMKELVRIASEEVTLYFAQRRPHELAKFEWNRCKRSSSYHQPGGRPHDWRVPADVSHLSSLKVLGSIIIFSSAASA
jgi:hypothetical protein